VFEQAYWGWTGRVPDRFGHYEFQNEFGLENDDVVNRCCFAATTVLTSRTVLIRMIIIASRTF
jgi:hypothetical protein